MESLSLWKRLHSEDINVFGAASDELAKAAKLYKTTSQKLYAEMGIMVAKQQEVAKSSEKVSFANVFVPLKKMGRSGGGSGATDSADSGPMPGTSDAASGATIGPNGTTGTSGGFVAATDDNRPRRDSGVASHRAP